jgi:AcrR family transcriptional regulator
MSDYPSDGRVLRGERNRELIVDAIIALFREGRAPPTAEAVAKRAKVGRRTVFRHFEDMSSLRAAVTERIADEVRPIFRAARFSGGTEERVRELVRCRTRIFERIAPIRRAQTDEDHRSAIAQDGRAELDRHLRDQMFSALGDELTNQDPDVAECLDALLSWESWNRLRSIQRLGKDRVGDLLTSAAIRLLTIDISNRRSS